MKGKDLINKIVRVDMPDIEQVRENCHRQATTQKRQEKRLLRRPAFAAATAAVLVMCLVFGSVLFNPQDGGVMNAFTIRAYAMEQRHDGSVVLREVDLMEQSDIWGGFMDNDNFFLSVRLQAVGDNIQSVNFITDDGFFAKQYLEIENGEVVIGNASVLFVGESDLIALVGTDFEIIGSYFTLDSNDMTDNLLLFLGMNIADRDTLDGLLPSQMIIRAVATFIDGTIQEEIITISLKGESIIATDRSDEPWAGHGEWWKNINLDEAELLPDSVTIIPSIQSGLVYEYQVDGFHRPLAIYEYQLQFNENGIAWGDFMSDFLISDGNVYFSVVKRDDNGVLTGMVYRVQIENVEMGLQEIQLNP